MRWARWENESGVYFIQKFTTKEIKIGHSYDIGIHAKLVSDSEGTSNVRVLTSVPGGEELAKEFRKRLQGSRLKRQRTKRYTEWFRQSKEVCDLIFEVAKIKVPVMLCGCHIIPWYCQCGEEQIYKRVLKRRDTILNYEEIQNGDDRWNNYEAGFFI